MSTGALTSNGCLERQQNWVLNIHKARKVKVCTLNEQEHTLASSTSQTTPIRLTHETRAYWLAYAERNGYGSIGECCRAVLEKLASNKAIMVTLPEPTIIELEYRAKKRGRDLQGYMSLLLEMFVTEEVIEEKPAAPAKKRKK